MENDEKNKNLKNRTTEEKIEKMRSSILDEQKCKMIAKKLTQYILENNQ